MGRPVLVIGFALAMYVPGACAQMMWNIPQYNVSMYRGAEAASESNYRAELCFVDPVWTADEVVVTRDIAYGSAYNNYTGQQQILKLDLYTPPSSDARSQRPAMVLVHGGSFVGGNKETDGEPALATALAQRGFVAVSIDYRLTGAYWGAVVPPGECCPGTQSDQYARDAAHDAKAALRFLRSEAKALRLDEQRLGIAGDSAGAVTALFVGYVATGEGQSGNPGFSSDVGVVLPISGELAYDAFCKGISSSGIPYGCHYGIWNDTDKIISPTQPPLGLVHGTMDTVVPIREALALQARANQVGLTNRLISIPGAGHVPMKELLTESDYLVQTMNFLVEALSLDSVPTECPRKSL